MKSTTLENLFKSELESFGFIGNKLALAVSGGPDSMALLYIAHLWSAESGKMIVAITVDHNLRGESRAEAEYVSGICKNLGIEHHILTWIREDGAKTMHDASREARYNLLTGYCRENGIDTILTAHNADDKIEHFFIRLSKASGLLGLVPGDVNFYGNIRILRPLSNVYKRDLESYIAKLGVKACYDMSNSDPKYQRSNIRKWISMIPDELDPDLFKHRMLKSISYLSDSAIHTRDLFVEELAERSVIYPSGYATYQIHLKNADISLMVISHLLTVVGGASFMPRVESVQKLYDRLCNPSTCDGGNNKFKATLHGCVVEKVGNSISFYRSFGRNAPVRVPLNKDVKWDGRWRSNVTYDNLFVTNLSMESYRELKKDPIFVKKSSYVSRSVLFTIPVILSDLEKVLAIPHIGYYNTRSSLEEALVFEPNYMSRLVDFCWSKYE